jgi:hypothetical protein
VRRRHFGIGRWFAYMVIPRFALVSLSRHRLVVTVLGRSWVPFS